MPLLLERSKFMKKFALIIIVFFTANFSFFSPQIKEIPELLTTTFSNRNFDLSKQRSKIVLINFWASWSLECEKETAFLNKIYAKYNRQTLEIIGISLDEEENREKAFRASFASNYPNIFVSDIVKDDFKKPQNLPTSYLIDKKGRITKIYNNRQDLEKHLESDLKELLTQQN